MATIQLILVTQIGTEHAVAEVASLEEAMQIVHKLDAEYAQWEANGFPRIVGYMNHYEGCDIIAVLPDGSRMLAVEDSWERA